MRSPLFLAKFLAGICLFASAHAFCPLVSFARCKTQGAFNSLRMKGTTMEKESVLIIGGTRFSGAYLWKELKDRGHDVTLFNRGATPVRRLPGETQTEFVARKETTKYIRGDRKDARAIRERIDPALYSYVYDMNGCDAADTAPIADIFARSRAHAGRTLKSYVYMSSAGVYKRREDGRPLMEGDDLDPNPAHRGKVEAESYLSKIESETGGDFGWCAFRPTYICGPGNYNSLENYFLERVDTGRPVCVPGNGAHLVGLCHARDVAAAMANVIGREDTARGQVYNLQSRTPVSLNGLVRAAAAAVGRDPLHQEIIHVDTSEIKVWHDNEIPHDASLDAFPMPPSDFFASIDKAMKDLEWAPDHSGAEDIMRDAYVHDYLVKKREGKIYGDFHGDELAMHPVLTYLRPDNFD